MNYKKTEQDYLDELYEQFDLLIDYCKQFDEGKLNYTKPMATLLRVLIHDGSGGSRSLFTLLKRKAEMKFCSTSQLYNNHDDILYLVTLITPVQKPIFQNGQIIRSELIFVPNLNRNTNPKLWVTFDEWNKSPIYIHNKENDDGLIMLDQKPGSKLIVSRSDIITYFANKDGGAHVDPKVNMNMYSLSKSLSSMAYEDKKDPQTYKLGEKYAGAIPYQNSLHAALRQIAHEMISTIRKEFNLSLSYNPSHKQIAGYKLDKTFDTCVRFNPKTRQASISH